MEPREFLTLATLLFTSYANEAACRTAISRGYYAAYHTGRRFVEGLGFKVFESGKGHTQVSFWLQNAGNPLLRKAGIKLQSLFGDRNDADYGLDLDAIWKENKVKSCLGIAEEIFNILNTDYSGQQSIIKEAMEHYRKVQAWP